jgi:hypothetical protein
MHMYMGWSMHHGMPSQKKMHHGMCACCNVEMLELTWAMEDVIM